MKSIYNSILLLLLIASKACLGQTEIKLYSSTAYQPKHFMFSEKLLFETFDNGDWLFESLNLSYAFGIDYAYFINERNGISLDVAYGIYDMNFQGDGIPIATVPVSIAFHTGEKLRFTSLFLNYHYRTKANRKSKLTIDLNTGLGIMLKSVYEARTVGDLSNGVGGGGGVGGGSDPITVSPLSPIEGNYYGLNFEPSFIWNLGRNMEDKGIDLSAGVPFNMFLLEKSNFNPKFTFGVSLGVILVL